MDRAIVSQFVPHELGTASERRILARNLNEQAARLGHDHPKRFGFFVTLPITSIEDSLNEIAYGFDVLNADGVAMTTSIGRRWLGDAHYTPIYEELNRRKAVVFVHPIAGECCSGLIPAVPDYVVEFATDTSRAIANLIWTGTTTRYPDIRFIFAHGGGSMPYLIERFMAGTSAEIVPGIVTHGKRPPFVPHQPPQGPLAELRRMYFEVAQASNPVALSALRQVVPVSQILYGSDYGYRTNVETVEGLASSKVFSSDELRSIGYRNARRLFRYSS